MEALAEKIYGPGEFSIEYIKQKGAGTAEYLDTADSSSNENTMQQLERRYMLEEKIMDAMANSDSRQMPRLFSMIEVLSTCPTNWGMTPVEALKWLEENMIPQYPLGVFKEV